MIGPTNWGGGPITPGKFLYADSPMGLDVNRVCCKQVGSHHMHDSFQLCFNQASHPSTPSENLTSTIYTVLCRLVGRDPCPKLEVNSVTMHANY